MVSPISAVIFDLDGVIRHFDPDHRSDVERRYGLEPGVLWRVAFAEPLGTELVTGVVTRAEWLARIGAEIGSPRAAEEWLGARGAVDPKMERLLIELALRPVSVALLTNGTDTIDAELHRFGLRGRFDRIFNSHFIGSRKPSSDVYRHVADELGLAPDRIWFTDDSAANVEGARAVGFRASTFVDAATTSAELVALGVLPSPG